MGKKQRVYGGGYISRQVLLVMKNLKVGLKEYVRTLVFERNGKVYMVQKRPGQSVRC